MTVPFNPQAYAEKKRKELEDSLASKPKPFDPAAYAQEHSDPVQVGIQAGLQQAQAEDASEVPTPEVPKTPAQLRGEANKAERMRKLGSGKNIFENPLLQANEYIVKGIANAAMSAQDAIKETITHLPDAIGGMFGGAVGAVTGMFSQSPVTTAKGIIWDGLIKPTLIAPLETISGYNFDDGTKLTNEQRIEKSTEAVNNIAGMVAASAVAARVASGISGTGKIAKTLGVSNLDELGTVLATVEPSAAIEAASLARNVSPFVRTKAAIGSAAAAGMTYGVMQGDTPQERFKNAVDMGVAGALLGGVMHKITGGKAEVRKLNKITAAGDNYALMKNLTALSPDAAGKLASDMMEGIDLVSVLDKNYGSGGLLEMKGIRPEALEGFTADRKAWQEKNPNIIVSPRADGLLDIMHDSGKLLNEAERNSYAAKKYFNNQSVNYKGGDYFVTNADGAYIEIRSVKDGKVLTVPPSEVTASNVISIADPETYSVQSNATEAVLDATVQADKITQGPGKLYQFELPKSYSRAFPKFETRNIMFASDFDRAVYLTSEKSKVFREQIKRDYELTDFDLAAHKLRLVASVKEFAKNNPGNKPISIGATPLKVLDPMAFGSVLGKGEKLTPQQIKSHIFGHSLDVEKSLTDLLNDQKALFTPDELAIIEKNKAIVDTGMLEERQSLLNTAIENGMRVNGLGNGKFELYNGASNSILAKFDKIADANEWLRTSGQIVADEWIPFDQPVIAAIGPSTMRAAKDLNFGEMERDKWNASSPFSSGHDYFIALEKKTGIPFYSNVNLILDGAKRNKDAAMTRVIPTIKTWLKPLKDLDMDQRHLIFDAQESLSPKEIIDGHKMKPNEINVSENLAKGTTKADRQVAYDFIKAMRDKRKDFKPETILDDMTDEQRYATNVLLNARGLGVDLTKSFEASKQGEFNIYASVTRLADALDPEIGGVTRAEFMKNHDFTPEMIKAVEGVSNTLNLLGNELQIPLEKRIPGYISHLFDYGDPTGYMGNNLVVNKFFADLPRTGEIQNLLKDPVTIIQTYMNKGYENRYMAPAIEQADAFMTNIKDEGTTSRYNQYKRAVLNKMDQHDQTALNTTVEMHKNMSIDPDLSLDVFNIIAKTVEFSTQGGKVIAGPRDFFNSTANMYVKLGPARTAEAFRMFRSAFKDAETLKGMAKFSGLSRLPWATWAEEASKSKGQKFSEIANKVGEVGFKMSMQPQAFDMYHTMTYLESYKHTLEKLTEYNETNHPDVTPEVRAKAKTKFIRDTKIETFDKPIQDYFMKLVEADNFLGAADFLAKRTGDEIVGYFANGRAPFAFSSKWGKLGGQLGNWSMWQVENFKRLATQGTKEQRAMAMVRIGTVFGAAYGATKLTGLNLMNWSNDPVNAIFTGSPTMQAVGDVAEWIKAKSSGSPMEPYYRKNVERLTYDFTRFSPLHPIPSIAYSWAEAFKQIQMGAPPYVVGAILTGINPDREKYPRP